MQQNAHMQDHSTLPRDVLLATQWRRVFLRMLDPEGIRDAFVIGLRRALEQLEAAGEAPMNEGRLLHPAREALVAALRALDISMQQAARWCGAASAAHKGAPQLPSPPPSTVEAVHDLWAAMARLEGRIQSSSWSYVHSLCTINAVDRAALERRMLLDGAAAVSEPAARSNQRRM